MLRIAGVAAALLLAASLAAILLDDGGRPRTVTSLRGQAVELYGGQGLYRYDSVDKAVLFRGFDWANLFVGLPVFVFAIHRRRLFQGQLLLAAVFTYLAYNYLIGVMGNAFNALFLVWTALFSLGIFGSAAVVAGMDVASLPSRMKPGFPRRTVSIYMIVLGLLLLLRYLAEILGGGSPPPALGIYTTLELAALELGIMVPLHLLGGIWLWKGKPLGYLLASVLAFTACMTFVSLTVASVMLAVSYGRTAVAGLAMPLSLAVITTAFSVAIFRGAANAGEPSAAR